VEVLKRQRFAGSEVFVVRQPDGTLTHVPCWMMQEAASRHVVCPDPLLTLPHLRDLRIEIDALLVFLRSDSKTEKGQEDAHRDPSAKRSVRGGGTADGSIGSSEESQMLPLLQAMLIEVSTATAVREADYDEDNA
jgi:hypothetical protein